MTMEVDHSEAEAQAAGSPHQQAEAEASPQAANQAQPKPPGAVPHPPMLPAMPTPEQAQQLQATVDAQAKELALLRLQLQAQQQPPPTQSVSRSSTPRLPSRMKLKYALQTQRPNIADWRSTSGLTTSVGSLNLSSNPARPPVSATPRHARRRHKDRSLTPPNQSARDSSSTSRQLVRFHPYSQQSQTMAFWQPPQTQRRRSNKPKSLDPVTQSRVHDSVQKKLGALNALERKEKRMVQAQMAANEDGFQQRLQRATKSTERHLKNLETELEGYFSSLSRGQTVIEHCEIQLDQATQEDSLPEYRKALEEAQAKQARRMEKKGLCQDEMTEVLSRLGRLQNGDEEAVQEVEKIQQDLADERRQQPEASTST
jgi:hypothetical protein